MPPLRGLPVIARAALRPAAILPRPPLCRCDAFTPKGRGLLRIRSVGASFARPLSEARPCPAAGLLPPMGEVCTVGAGLAPARCSTCARAGGRREQPPYRQLAGSLPPPPPGEAKGCSGTCPSFVTGSICTPGCLEARRWCSTARTPGGAPPCCARSENGPGTSGTHRHRGRGKARRILRSSK